MGMEIAFVQIDVFHRPKFYWFRNVDGKAIGPIK